MHPPFSAPKNHPPNMVQDMSNSPTAIYRDCSDLPVSHLLIYGLHLQAMRCR